MMLAGEMIDLLWQQSHARDKVLALLAERRVEEGPLRGLLRSASADDEEAVAACQRLATVLKDPRMAWLHTHWPRHPVVGYDVQLRLSPFDPQRVGPNSYDVVLSATLKRYAWNRLSQEDCVLDCRADNPTAELVIPETGLVLFPGELYLGTTVEHTETEGLVPCLEGRSSLGRLGMSVHATAGFGDNGFKGHWTFEISVVKRLRIYPNMRIAQLSYSTLLGSKPRYQGRYQRQQDPEASRLWLDYQQSPETSCGPVST